MTDKNTRLYNCVERDKPYSLLYSFVLEGNCKRTFSFSVVHRRLPDSQKSFELSKRYGNFQRSVVLSIRFHG
ncbi:hypothetical protein L596_004707 [Steinernema carpocapsae]|uniref:Uncharacterized protein n=1 Tax=Steinernema carpocapsae TaxID=34508 RepID=A0A4U8UWM0_STECR|nr:hypothetical protein L596_004707 [Steinernema carpocapsae]